MAYPTGSEATDIRPYIGQFFDGGGAIRNVMHPDFGVVANGTNDDTAGVQAGIDALDAIGGGILWFPAVGSTTYRWSQIKLKTGVALVGAGWGTYCRQLDSTSGHMIILDDDTVEKTAICNMRISGNKANQTASNNIIHYANQDAGIYTFGPPVHWLIDLYLHNAKNDCVNVDGRGEMRAINVFCSAADNNGFTWSIPDSVLVGCTVGSCAQDGFSIEGANNRLVGCKAFFCERDGYRIANDRTALSACEAQDNDRHGFLFTAVKNCIGSALIADSNNADGASNGAGVRMDNADNCMIQVAAFDRDGTPTQEYGVRLVSGSDGNVIDLVTDDTNTLGDILDNAGGTNMIRVNGTQLDRVGTLADDATPSVKNGRCWKTGGTTTITDLDDGVVGQVVEILAKHAITFKRSSGILELNGAVDFVMASGDTLTLRMFEDQVWYEIARSVN